MELASCVYDATAEFMLLKWGERVNVYFTISHCRWTCLSLGDNVDDRCAISTARDVGKGIQYADVVVAGSEIYSSQDKLAAPRE